MVEKDVPGVEKVDYSIENQGGQHVLEHVECKVD